MCLLAVLTDDDGNATHFQSVTGTYFSGRLAMIACSYIAYQSELIHFPRINFAATSPAAIQELKIKYDQCPSLAPTTIASTEPAADQCSIECVALIDGLEKKVLRPVKATNKLR